jgi:hypothetical protein
MASLESEQRVQAAFHVEFDHVVKAPDVKIIYEYLRYRTATFAALQHFVAPVRVFVDADGSDGDALAVEQLFGPDTVWAAAG